jgi:hypothetical protein
MFSLKSWYDSKQSVKYKSQIQSILYLNKIPKSIHAYIFNFIICPKCNCVYTDTNECYCWFVNIFFAKLTIIPEGKDTKAYIDDDYKLI